MAEVEEDRGATLCEDEDDEVIDLDSDEDEDDWELGDDEDDESNTALYDSPIDKIDEVLHFGAHLQ